MLEHEATIIEMPEASEPMVHQIAKLLIGAIVGFIATRAVDKAYDATLDSYRSKRYPFSH